MEDFSNLLAVAALSFLGTISPGPDFCIVLRNSLSYSRKSGFLTALGISCSLIFHLAYTLVGIGILIAESPFCYALIKYTGVVYLFYIGLSSLIFSFKNSSSLNLKSLKSLHQLPPSKAFMQGFLTNLLNPESVIFFISLFSQFIGPNTSTFLKIEYAFINWFISLSWLLFLSYLVTTSKLMKKIHSFQIYIDRIMGSTFLLIGVKLLFA